MLWWVWAVGAALMAALGPSPRWLAADFVEEGGGELPAWKRWTLWSAQIALWPAALCWHARQAMYRPR